MISTDSPFDPRRSNRGEETVIDGHETHWYRGEIASAPDAQVRETLIELDDGRVAPISLRAASEAELADALTQAQLLRDRKCDVSGKSGSVRVCPGGRRTT